MQRAWSDPAMENMDRLLLHDSLNFAPNGNQITGVETWRKIYHMGLGDGRWSNRLDFTWGATPRSRFRLVLAHRNNGECLWRKDTQSTTFALVSGCN